MQVFQWHGFQPQHNCKLAVFIHLLNYHLLLQAVFNLLNSHNGTSKVLFLFISKKSMYVYSIYNFFFHFFVLLLSCILCFLFYFNCIHIDPFYNLFKSSPKKMGENRQKICIGLRASLQFQDFYSVLLLSWQKKDV